MNKTAERDFDWRAQPAAETAFRAVLSGLLRRCPDAQSFADHLLSRCGVRLRDIIDHIASGDPAIHDALTSAGWSEERPGELRNRDGYFPALLLRDGETVVFLRVESVEDFLLANNLAGQPISGVAHGPARSAIAFRGDNASFGLFERNGYVGFDIPEEDSVAIRSARLHLQRFRARRRQFDTIEQGLAYTEYLVDAAVADLGSHWSCHLWLHAEREYWMRRCSAGHIQKARQDRVGIGWANIDHHTYDGSRRHYRHTIRILEKLGYERREMIYAGELAGWGSQVLEQPALQSTIFADVDLAPHEIDVDFSHDVLPDLDRHRRAGLVSALHGESILEAGLNHVAAMYDQRRLRAQLEDRGVKMMSPFSDFSHLYQELTIGDRVAVDPERIDQLEREGHIRADEAETLRMDGMILSHLENIERNDGYRGFNKPGIDGVLRKLDPRHEEPVAAQ